MQQRPDNSAALMTAAQMHLDPGRRGACTIAAKLGCHPETKAGKENTVPLLACLSRAVCSNNAALVPNSVALQNAVPIDLGSDKTVNCLTAATRIYVPANNAG